eukprot:2192088-Pyramimonas_sp.AAC.1
MSKSRLCKLPCTTGRAVCWWWWTSPTRSAQSRDGGSSLPCAVRSQSTEACQHDLTPGLPLDGGQMALA